SSDLGPGGGGVGGLGVVDEADAVDGGEVLGAMGAHAVGAQPVAYGMGRDAVRAGERGRGEGVQEHVGAGALGAQVGEVGEGGELGGGAAALGVEGAVDEDAVDDPELGQARGAQRDADGAGALDDVRLLDQVQGGLIGGVVDAGGADALEDASLGAGVLLGAAVPVEVVGAHVQHNRGLAVQVLGPVQLEAGQL